MYAQSVVVLGAGLLGKDMPIMAKLRPPLDGLDSQTRVRPCV